MGRKNKLNQKVGEVEVEYFVFPKEIREAIEKNFLAYRGTGRKSILLKIKEAGKDPLKVLLKMYYLMNVEGYSYRDLSEWVKKEIGLEVSKSALNDFVKRLKQLGVHERLVLMSTEKVKRRLRYYFITADGEIRSDIDYVQQYIESRKHTKSRSFLIKSLKYQAYACKVIGKLPHEWTREDLTKFINMEFERRLKRAKEVWAKHKDDPHHRYYGLSEVELENKVRVGVFSVVVALRSILKYIGRNDLCEQVLKTDAWKRVMPLIERRKEYLDPDEIKKILSSKMFTREEKIMIKLHLTLGCREGWHQKGGLWNLRWRDLDLEGKRYGYPSADVFEGKTKGGVIWRGIDLTLFFPDLPKELMEYRKKAKNDDERVLETLGFTMASAQRVYKKIQRVLGRRFTGHFVRHTHATLLIRMGVPMELVAGKPEFSRFGVGWEDLSTLYKFYVAIGKWNYEQYIPQVKAFAKSFSA